MRRAINTCTYNIIVTDAPSIHVTDFPVVKVHVDELPSARIWQNNLCAILSASVNIKYHLSIKVCYRICTVRCIRIEKKPACVLSLTWVGRIYFDSSSFWKITSILSSRLKQFSNNYQVICNNKL